jgi:hypothetical protein
MSSRRFCYICVQILLCVCLILIYICSTTIYMCPSTIICVLILLCVLLLICVLILLYICSTTMCPNANICVLVLLHICGCICSYYYMSPFICPNDLTCAHTSIYLQIYAQTSSLDCRRFFTTYLRMYVLILVYISRYMPK